jgi:hypothetical protein
MKAHHSNTIVHGRMLCTHVTDTLHMTGSKTFFSSNQHYDWRATHCLRSTEISLPGAARQIKQLPPTDGILSMHHLQVLYMTGRRRYTLLVAANQRRAPRSLVYGKTRPSLLGLFGVVRNQHNLNISGGLQSLLTCMYTYDIWNVQYKGNVFC